MQPDQNPIPVDYLNTIAPEPTKSPMNNKLFFGVIIGALIVLVLAVVFIVTTGGSSNTQSLERLGLRLQSLQTISKNAEKNIQSSALLSTNGNLSTYLVNTNRNIATPLSAAGINLKKANKTLIVEESGTELSKKLEDARLNAVFDRTYAREMAYQLETTAVLMNKLYKSTNSTSLKAYLPGAYKDIVSLQKQMEDVSTNDS